ncbi:MAG TPA: exodeoxyribonuclease III [Candidatus Paceibacterota bacterium]|nr:exodeoxyribonuclease III [Candidatus Paceibacterota bacterium]
MRIVSWNVNGIRAVHKKGLFEPMIEKLKPDILCLQETKALEHESEIDLIGYEEYWNSAQKKGYSGTAIFTKHKPLSVTFDFPEEIVKRFALQDGYGDLNAEGRLITLEFDRYYIVDVYTPNSKGDLSRLPMRYKHWDPAFLAYCKELEKHKPIIFCGDLNVAHTEDDLANPKENDGEHGFTKEEREGIDKVLQAGFVDTFRKFHQGKGHYTWWSPWRAARDRNIGWRIDYLFVSKAIVSRVTSAHIHPHILGSDHCPISIDIDL